MGSWDTEALWGIPCLARLYLRAYDGSEEFDLLNAHGDAYAGNEDMLLMPGRIPFEGRLYADWEVDGKTETTEWPNLPPQLKWDTVVFTDEEFAWAERHDGCEMVYLAQNGDDRPRHVFYRRGEESGRECDREWTGILAPGTKMKAWWWNADGLDGEERDWKPDLPEDVDEEGSEREDFR